MLSLAPRVVGPEVDEGDLVLGVGVTGDLGDDVLELLREDDGEFHLDGAAGDHGLVAYSA